MLLKPGIRRRLALLLLIPLMAVLLTLAPLFVGLASDAAAAGGTARVADAARDIGVLIQDLQQERLLALGFLTTPQLDRSALLSQAEAASADADRLRSAAGSATVLHSAGSALAALDSFRARVLARSVDPTSVCVEYRQTVLALLDALRLTSSARADAADQRRLEALDELMRANEEAAGVGAALVAVAGDSGVSHKLLTDALAAQNEHTDRFRRLVSAQQATLLDEVEQGQAAKRVNQLVNEAAQAGPRPGTARDPVAANVADALTAANSVTGLRRIAEDRIAREIAAAAERRARTAELTLVGVAGGAVLLLLLVTWLGVLVSRSIAGPLARLTAAATRVADLAEGALDARDDAAGEPDGTEDAEATVGIGRLPEVSVRGDDELAALATAFNRVQRTSAQLIGRQVAARRSVAVMFTNIARRTQNLVGRQLAQIDALRPAPPDPGDRYQPLELLTARLRRSADSLLVVAGSSDQGVGGTPTRLADVFAAAMAEIEGFSAVRLGALPGLVVTAGFVADLRLLLAELLENAINFSPPGSSVEASASRTPEGCQITIVDHGLGISPQRLAEENQRLVQRERLDVAPTRMLGLFVVGRLARRHGLTVQLDHTEGGGITATVAVPFRLFAAPATAALASTRPSARAPRPLPMRQVAVPARRSDANAFDWFGAPAGDPGDPGDPGEPREATEPGEATLPLPSVPRGLLPPPLPDPDAIPRTPVVVEFRPAQPGPALPEPVPSRRDNLHPVARNGGGVRGDIPTPPASLAATLRPALAAPPGADPAATRPGKAERRPGKVEQRAGLTRRVPGQNLGATGRQALARRAQQSGRPGQASAPTPAVARDPDAERAAVDGFLAGFARAGSDGSTDGTSEEGT